MDLCKYTWEICRITNHEFLKKWRYRICQPDVNWFLSKVSVLLKVKLGLMIRWTLVSTLKSSRISKFRPWFMYQGSWALTPVVGEQASRIRSRILRTEPRNSKKENGENIDVLGMPYQSHKRVLSIKSRIEFNNLFKKVIWVITSKVIRDRPWITPTKIRTNFIDPIKQLCLSDSIDRVSAVLSVESLTH